MRKHITCDSNNAELQDCMAETSTSTEKLRHQTRLWLNVLRLHGLVFPILNRRMLEETGLSLAKFDAMAQLARNPDGLSMGRLSDALKVTNGNVSGLVNRLIKDGVVVKVMSTGDRRSFLAKLTDEGQVKFKQASEAHNRLLAAMLSEVSEKEMTEANSTLLGLLKSIQQSVEVD